MRYVDKLWSLRFAILTFVVLQAFDTLSTMLALGAGGGEEGNPVMAQALASAGWQGLFLAKLGVIALVYAAVWIDPLHSPYVRASLVIMNVVYGLVLSSNFAAYGLATGDWVLPSAFWALLLAVSTVAVDETFFGQRARHARARRD